MPFQRPSEDCNTRCCRKTAWPQVPATHEYAALTFETLQQISQPPSLVTPIHSQPQGFSSKQRTACVGNCCNTS